MAVDPGFKAVAIFRLPTAEARLPPSRSGSLLLGRGDFHHAHDVALLHDQEFFAIDLHFSAGPLAEQDAVAHRDVERVDLAVLVARTGADGDDFAFLRLFLGAVRDDDAALGLLLAIKATTTTRSCRGRNFMSQVLNLTSNVFEKRSRAVAARPLC